MTQDYTRIYLFLGQQGSNWFHVADANHDSVLIKPEWQNYVTSNWDGSCGNLPGNDLINSFFDNILNTTQGYGKAGSTMYNQSNAVDNNEANQVAVTVAVYSLKSEFETFFPGFNSLGADIQNAVIQNIVNQVKSAGVTNPDPDNIRDLIVDNGETWVYSFANNKLLANQKQLIVGQMLSQAGIPDVSVDLPEITNIWNQCVADAGLSPLPTNRFITGDVSALNQQSCSEIKELIDGNHAPINGATIPSFYYVSALHKPQLENRLKSELNIFEGYQRNPGAFNDAINTYLNDLENKILTGYMYMGYTSLSQYMDFMANDITTPFAPFLQVNETVMQALRFEEFFQNGLDKYSNLTDSAVHDALLNKLKTAMGLTDSDKAMMEILNKILGAGFKDTSANVMALLKDDMMSNPSAYLDENNNIKEEAILTFLTSAILENIDDFIKISQSMSISTMGDYFNFAYQAVNSASNGSLDTLKDIAKDVCNALCAKGSQTEVTKIFGANYNDTIDGYVDRSVLKTDIDKLLKAAATSNPDPLDDPPEGTKPTTASSMASDNITTLSFTNANGETRNCTIESLLEWAGRAKGIITMHTGTNITSGKNFVLNKITAIGKALKNSEYGYDNAAAIDTACSKAKSVYERLYEQFIKATPKSNNKEVLASDYNDVNYSTSEGEHSFTCKTWKNDCWNENLLKNKKDKMLEMCQKTSAGLTVVQNGNRNSNNFEVYTFLDMGRVVEMISKFLDA